MDILPVLKTGKLIVLYTPDAARTESMTLIAELGLRGAVTILDGGNRYRPYQVAHIAAQENGGYFNCRQPPVQPARLHLL